MITNRKLISMLKRAGEWQKGDTVDKALHRLFEHSFLLKMLDTVDPKEKPPHPDEEAYRFRCGPCRQDKHPDCNGWACGCTECSVLKRLQETEAELAALRAVDFEGKQVDLTDPDAGQNPASVLFWKREAETAQKIIDTTLKLLEGQSIDIGSNKEAHDIANTVLVQKALSVMWERRAFAEATMLELDHDKITPQNARQHIQDLADTIEKYANIIEEANLEIQAIEENTEACYAVWLDAEMHVLAEQNNVINLERRIKFMTSFDIPDTSLDMLRDKYENAIDLLIYEGHPTANLLSDMLQDLDQLRRNRDEEYARAEHLSDELQELFVLHHAR